MNSTIEKLFEIIKSQAEEIERLKLGANSEEIIRLKVEQEEKAKEISRLNVELLRLTVELTKEQPSPPKEQTNKYPVFKVGSQISKSRFIDLAHHCIHGLTPPRSQKELLFDVYFEDVRKTYPTIYVKQNIIYGIWG